MMDTAQILYTLKDVSLFLGVYPSDVLRTSITRSVTLIVNTDPHTAKGTHWLAIHLQPRSYSGYFFDSYALLPLNPSILTFLRCAFSVWEYNTIQLQGWNSTVCGEYCCLFALYMDLGTRRGTLWASSMPPPLIDRSAAYLHQSLDRCVGHVAGVGAALHL